jgi:hypothetical protein
MKATYAAPGFNANVESPIWYAPGSEQAHQNDTKLMSEAPVIGLMRSLSATNRIPKGDRECASSPGSHRSRRS